MAIKDSAEIVCGKQEKYEAGNQWPEIGVGKQD